MRVVTWNVNSLRVRLEHVLRWVEENQPDVLGLQEIKTVDKDFPFEEFQKIGYRALSNGQKTYNGVALIYKESLDPEQIEKAIPTIDDPQKRVITANFGPLRVMNLYVPNGQTVGSEKYDYKLQWLEHLRQHIQETLKEHPNLVVMGDFNITPTDEDVHDPEQWKDKILCSKPERQALDDILSLGMLDSFRQFPQPEKSYSWWDYRAIAFRRNRGLRIDLILASKPLMELAESVHIDKEPRGWERPSDHTPVVANFSI